MNVLRSAFRPILHSSVLSQVHGNQSNYFNSGTAGANPYPCSFPDCKHSYTSPEALRQHGATHKSGSTGPRFKCTKGCDCDFGSRDALLAHEASSAHRTLPFSLRKFMRDWKRSSFCCCMIICTALPVAWRYKYTCLMLAVLSGTTM